ncbi:unnamed protein product [marine sediment metagenome]|uniref:Uncharacterized protein n=1 Tax=marine sediment metagenome TaxID=412755 RepID=X1DGE6_9ZZZZ
MSLGDLEMREKYPRAVDLLDAAIHVICDAYELKTKEPIHDLAGWILTVFFNEQ